MFIQYSNVVEWNILNIEIFVFHWNFTCTSGRCNRKSEFTLAFYDVSVILRSAAALFK